MTETQTNSQPASNGAKGNVLLIDDDKFLADMYAMKFQQAGFNVQACLSSADALKVLREGFAANAIVFDLIMPEGDGFSFLQALQSEKLAGQATKIALTNEMNDDEKTKVIQMGAALYIVKATMIPSEVVSAVGEAIAKKKAL